MEAIQANPQQFSYQAAIPTPRTLDDYRVMHINYDSGGSFAAKAVRPALIIAFAIGAVIVGMKLYSDHAAVNTDMDAIHSTGGATTSASVGAASRATMPTVPAASAPVVTEPLRTPNNSTLLTPAPLPAAANNAIVEPLKAVKSKSSVTAKSTPPLAKKIAPIPETPTTELTPLKMDAAPAPVVAPEEKPPVPTPAPDVPAVDPAK